MHQASSHSLELHYNQVFKKLSAAKHQHLLQFYKMLAPRLKEHLLDDLDNCDVREMQDMFKSASLLIIVNITPLKPSPTFYAQRKDCSDHILNQYKNIGLQKLAEGKVCLLSYCDTTVLKGLIVGLHKPGLLSEKTIFQLQAEQIFKVIELSRAVRVHGKRVKAIPWYILIHKRDEEFVFSYFEENRFFNLARESIHFIAYDLMPIFSPEGKLLLSDMHKVLNRHKGNGCIFSVMKKSGILESMKQGGVEYIFAFNSNNLLCKVADPVFIGYSAYKEADFSVKVVDRQDFEVGDIVCQVEKIIKTVPWHELPPDKDEKNSADQHLYNIIDTGIYVFSIRLALTVANSFEKFPLHIMEVKPPVIAQNRPEDKAFALEQHIFDAMAYSSLMVMWHVERSQEYCPLDLTELSGSTRARELAIYHKYFRDMIHQFGGMTQGIVEISPLISYDGEGLEEIVVDRLYENCVINEENRSTGNFYRDPFFSKKADEEDKKSRKSVKSTRRGSDDDNKSVISTKGKKGKSVADEDTRSITSAKPKSRRGSKKSALEEDTRSIASTAKTKKADRRSVINEDDVKKTARSKSVTPSEEGTSSNVKTKKNTADDRKSIASVKAKNKTEFDTNKDDTEKKPIADDRKSVGSVKVKNKTDIDTNKDDTEKKPIADDRKSVTSAKGKNKSAAESNKDNEDKEGTSAKGKTKKK